MVIKLLITITAFSVCYCSSFSNNNVLNVKWILKSRSNEQNIGNFILLSFCARRCVVIPPWRCTRPPQLSAFYPIMPINPFWLNNQSSVNWTRFSADHFVVDVSRCDIHKDTWLLHIASTTLFEKSRLSLLR